MQTIPHMEKSSMTRQVRRSFQPRLESLEERCTPSATSFGAHHLSDHSHRAHHVAALVPAGKSDDHTMTFKETLTVTSVSDGVYSYAGHATHLGHVTAFSFPDGSFTKITHN